MGMYDYIRCRYPLDKKHIQDDLFQTKSLNNYLQTYEIIQGGWLFHTHEIEAKLDRPELIRFTGEIRFYTFRNRTYGEIKKTYWYEYSAYFVKGRLKELESQHEIWENARRQQ